MSTASIFDEALLQPRQDALGATSSHKEQSETTGVWTVLLLTSVFILLSVGDTVLGGILFDRYGQVYAQYLNQATALVYCITSSIILLCRRISKPKSNECSSTDTGAPWWMLVIIGLMNGSGNFLQAIAQPHTANLTQSLLQLLGVPFVMVLSFIFLQKAPSLWALAGATLIVVGTIISALRTVLPEVTIVGGNSDSAGGVTSNWYSVVLFAMAQVVFSSEKVLEDKIFGRFLGQDAMVMFCWTMWVQFSLYIPLLPSQMLDVLGGLQLSEIPQVAWNGVRCTFGLTSTEPSNLPNPLPTCGLSNTLLFIAYCSVDMSCYFCGLYVIQKLGANCVVIASAVALPLQQLVFCLPFIVTAQYADKYYLVDAIALVVVGLGYYVYQWLSPEGSQTRKSEENDNAFEREFDPRGEFI